MGWKTVNVQAAFSSVENRRGDSAVDDRGVCRRERRERREALTATGSTDTRGNILATFERNYNAFKGVQLIEKPRNSADLMPVPQPSWGRIRFQIPPVQQEKRRGLLLLRPLIACHDGEHTTSRADPDAHRRISESRVHH